MADERIVTDAGERKALDKIAEITRRMALFINDATLSASNVIGDFTKPGYAGYADQTLDSWPAASTLGTGEASCTHPNVTFAYSGLVSSVTVYGLVIFDPSDSNVVIEVVKYETPVTLSGTGTHIVTHSLTAASAE
tara:strand:+ start:301 stop:708 length:408 start_codon:yes stop_codon:yes gene_type:complete